MTAGRGRVASATAACALLLLAGGCSDGTPGTTTGSTTASTATTDTVPTTDTTTTDTTTTTGEEAPIVVTQPQAFDVVVGSFVLAGTANVFEAHVSWALEKAKGPVQQGYVTATCGSGCRGTFRTRVRLTPDVGPGNYTLMVFETSARDGSRTNLVQVPLTVHATR